MFIISKSLVSLRCSQRKGEGNLEDYLKPLGCIILRGKDGIRKNEKQKQN